MNLDAGVLIPVVAIIVWGIRGAQKRSFDHRENMAARFGQVEPAVNSDVQQELQKLKEEIANLRDTSTRFDLSIDHHLQELDQRLQSVERRPASYTQPINADDVQQSVVPRS